MCTLSYTSQSYFNGKYRFYYLCRCRDLCWKCYHHRQIIIILWGKLGISGQAAIRNTESDISSASGTLLNIGTGIDVTIDGFQYTGVNFIQGSCDNLYVKDCKFTWNSHWGDNDIYLSNVFKYFSFENNKVILPYDVGAALQPIGNYNGSGTASKVFISGNYFQNTVLATWAVAVNLSSCQGEVKNNTFVNLDDAVLIANKCGNLTIDQNSFSGSTDGVDADHIAAIKFWGNGDGTSMLSGPINITNNFFDDCDFGVSTNNSPLIFGCTCKH